MLNAFDRAIFLPGIHLTIIVTHLHKDNRVFFAALFVKAKYWKQPKNPSIGDLINNDTVLKAGILCSHYKRMI